MSEEIPLDRDPLKRSVDKLQNSLAKRFQEAQAELVDGELLPQAFDPPEPGTTSVEYIRLLARLPIFVPTNERPDPQDGMTWSERSSPWGGVKIVGPVLNAYDEDTFLGVTATCQQRKLTRPRGQLPVAAPKLTLLGKDKPLGKGSESDAVTVIVGSTNAYAINNFLAVATGGDDLARRRESIQRISQTSLLIENHSSEGVISLFKYVGAKDARGELLIQFDPLISLLFDQPFYLDLNVRRQLKPVGKFVHRFLSTQLSRKKPDYAISLEKLRETVAYTREMKYFRRDVHECIETLKKIGWLGSADITGTGRSSPLKLVVSKAKPRPGATDE